MHDGTTDFLKLLSIFIFICVAVWWLDGAIGSDYTVLVIFALVGVIIFAGGALFAHLNQQSTLNAITKFNANDAQIDKYRMQTMKQIASGQTAKDKADAQVKVLEMKQIEEKEKQTEESAFWTYDEDDANADFEEWS